MRKLYVDSHRREKPEGFGHTHCLYVPTCTLKAVTSTRGPGHDAATGD